MTSLTVTLWALVGVCGGVILLLAGLFWWYTRRARRAWTIRVIQAGQSRPKPPRRGVF